MTSHVSAEIEIDAPVQVAYDQWTLVEELPEFMHNVREVRQIDDETSHWVVEVGGVTREFDARIIDQVPDDHITWESMGERLHSGRVDFEAIEPDRTRVSLNMDWEPETFVEKTGAALAIDDLAAKRDLQEFKRIVEDSGMVVGGWRGEIHGGQATPAGDRMDEWSADQSAESRSTDRSMDGSYDRPMNPMEGEEGS